MVNILGAGLAGSILKRVLDQHKIPNIIYDCKKEWRASPISENLFSLSWSNTLGTKVVMNGVKTLEGIANISSINFKTKAGYNSVLHVHPDDILVKKFVFTDVDLPIHEGKKDVTVDCRGYWAQLPDKEKMVGLTGQGLFFEGVLHHEPVMNFVAPYVHQKLFQWNKSFVWYGDSTCIDYKQYWPKRSFYERRCEQRARALLKERKEHDTSYHTIEHGIRPWVKGYKGYLHFNKRHIINTGGWKCGLIIYSDHAQKILKYIQNL